MTYKKHSDLDANQVIKVAQDPKTGALNVNKINSLVPTAYGKVELTYTTISGEDYIETATFYGDGDSEVTGIGINDVVGSSLNGKYFFIWSANDETKYYVWFSNGFGVDPAPGGSTAIPVIFANNDSKYVLSGKIALAINNVADFAAEAQADALIISNVTHGATTDSVDVDTGFQFYKVREGTDRKIVAILNMSYDGSGNLLEAERVFYG